MKSKPDSKMTTINDKTFLSSDILIVDDEIPSLKLLAEFLGHAGYQVRSTEKAQLAIDSAFAKPPALILLDVRMPEMDGYEVCKRLKQNAHTSDIPIIFISALQEMEDKVQAFKAGGVDYITKPFQEEEVLARVRTHLELRNMQLNLAELVAVRTAELHRSEAKYRDLVDNSIVGVFTTTLDGRFLFANDASARMYDFESPEQMVAQGSLSRWSDPKQRERMLAELQEHGSVTNFEAETITHTGRHIHVLFSAKLHADTISGMVMDITDRKQAEIALAKAHDELEKRVEERTAQLHAIIDNVQAVVFMKDLDCRYLLVNNYHQEAAGVKKEDAIGKTDFEVYPKEVADQFVSVDRKVMSSGEMQTFEEEVPHPDGRLRHYLTTKVPLFNDEGNVYGLCGLATDITERKRMEEETTRLLAETQQRNADLAIINRVGQELTGELDFQKMIELASETLSESLKAHTLYIALYDKQTHKIRFPYYKTGNHQRQQPAITLGQGLTSKILQSVQPLLCETLQQQIDQGRDHCDWRM